MKYLRGVYWGSVFSESVAPAGGYPWRGDAYDGFRDAFCFSRNVLHALAGELPGGGDRTQVRDTRTLLFKAGGFGIKSWQVSVCSKTYREIKPIRGHAYCDQIIDNVAVSGTMNLYEEDDIMFYKVIDRFGEHGVGSDDYRLHSG